MSQYLKPAAGFGTGDIGFFQQAGSPIAGAGPIVGSVNTPPDAVQMIVIATPAGGGGGGSNTAGTGGGGGGGGPGAATVTVFFGPLAPSYTYSVPSASLGGAPDAGGSNGGDLIFNGVTVAVGGGGGGGAPAGGGAGSNGVGYYRNQALGSIVVGGGVGARGGMSIWDRVGLTPENMQGATRGCNGHTFGSGGWGASTFPATGNPGGNGAAGYLLVLFLKASTIGHQHEAAETPPAHAYHV